MVYITQKMLRVLENRMDKGWFTLNDVKEIVGGTKKEHLQVLLDMYVQGLVDIMDTDKFRTTDQARRILEIWESLGKPSADPWIDSRIYNLLKASIEAGGYIPEKLRGIIEERGLLFEGSSALGVYEVIEALDSMEKRLVITKAIAAEILSVPEGPAEKKFYSMASFLDSLEAMGLIVKSIPYGHYMALTKPARILRSAFRELNIDAPVPVLLNRTIYDALVKLERGEKIPDDLREIIGKIGYVSGTGALTKAARQAMKAWRLISHPEETPPYSISSKELLLLRKIVEQWEKVKSNPEEAPTLKKLRQRLENEWSGEYYSITLTLYHLESMGLVERIEFNKRETFRTTKYADEILRTCQSKPVAVLASRSLIEADAGRGPLEEWIGIARDQGVVGSGGPTKYGLALQRASRCAAKSLFLTGLEALIIRRLPVGKSLPRNMIIDSFKHYGEDINIALDKLETRGYVKTTPVGYIVLTEIGELLKQVLMGVEKGIATPIYPPLIKVLKKVQEIGTDDIARLVNETKLDIDTVKTALIIARKAKFLGKGYSLTEAGRALLKIVEVMEERLEK